MLILKRRQGIGYLFNTDDLSVNEKTTKTAPLSDALHCHHHSTDYDFLKGFFPESHPVFENFGVSFYYVIPIEYIDDTPRDNFINYEIKSK